MEMGHTLREGGASGLATAILRVEGGWHGMTDPRGRAALHFQQCRHAGNRLPGAAGTEGIGQCRIGYRRFPGTHNSRILAANPRAMKHNYMISKNFWRGALLVLAATASSVTFSQTREASSSGVLLDRVAGLGSRWTTRRRVPARRPSRIVGANIRPDVSRFARFSTGSPCVGHSDGDALAALATARGQDRPAGAGPHPQAEAVHLVAAAVVGLVRTLAHQRSPWVGIGQDRGEPATVGGPVRPAPPTRVGETWTCGTRRLRFDRPTVRVRPKVGQTEDKSCRPVENRLPAAAARC